MMDPGDAWARRVLAPLRHVEAPLPPRKGDRKSKARRLRVTAAALVAASLTVSIAWAARQGIFAEIDQASIAPAASAFDVIAVFTSGPGDEQDIGYLDTGSGTIRPLVVANGNQTDPALSPDGSTVYYVSSEDRGGSTIEAVSVRDGTRSTIFGLDGAYVGSPTPAPTGDRLLVSAISKEAPNGPVGLWVMGVDGSEPSEIELSAEVADGPLGPRWSPDGKRFLAGVGLDEGEAALTPVVIELDGHVTSFTDAPPMAPAVEAAWAPNGEGFAYVSMRSGNGGATIWEAVVYVDLRGGGVGWQLALPEDRHIAHLRFSPDGTHLAAISDWVASTHDCSDEGYTYPCRDDGLIVFAADPDAEPTSLALGPDVYGPLWAADGGSLLYWQRMASGARLIAVDLDGQESTLIRSWASGFPEDEGTMQVGDSLISEPVSSPSPSSTAG